MITAEELVGRIKHLNSLPDLYMRLNNAINTPNSSFEMIGNLIRDDPSLCARLLRISNSSLYNFPNKIETIQRAMSIIGTKELREMVLATTVISLFEGMDTKISMKSFWQHSIACGIAARLIATVRRESNIERFYVAGILHDIGRLIIFSQFPAEASTIIFESVVKKKPLYELEKEEFGFDHAEVGATLLANWKLPLSHQESVRYHNNPNAAPNYPIEAGTIHVANILVNAMELGSSGSEMISPCQKDIFDTLNLKPQEINFLIDQIDEQYLEAVSLFLTDDKNE